MAATDDEGRRIARRLLGFLEWGHRTGAASDRTREVVDLVIGHLSETGTGLSVVTKNVALLDHVTPQLALDSRAWTGRGVHGIGVPPNYGSFSL